MPIGSNQNKEMGKVFLAVAQGSFVENSENMISLKQLQNKGRGRGERERGTQRLRLTERGWMRERELMRERREIEGEKRQKQNKAQNHVLDALSRLSLPFELRVQADEVVRRVRGSSQLSWIEMLKEQTNAYKIWLQECLHDPLPKITPLHPLADAENSSICASFILERAMLPAVIALGEGTPFSLFATTYNLQWVLLKVSPECWFGPRGKRNKYKVKRLPEQEKTSNQTLKVTEDKMYLLN